MSRLRELWAAFLRWYEARTDRERSILVGGGIVAALLLGYFAVIEPLLNLRADLATQIAERHAQLESEARLVTRAAALRSERDALRQRLKLEKEKLLPGESVNLARAALQERLNALASEKHVTVQSVQDLKDEPADPFVRVAVRLTVSGEIRPLSEMLAALEFGKTQISIPFIEMNRRGAVPGAKGPRPLSATIEASGFILSPAAAEARPEGEAAADGGPAAGGEGAAAPEGDGAPAGEGPAEGGPPPDAAVPPATAPTGAVPPPAPGGVVDGTAPPPVPPGPGPAPQREAR